MPGRGGGRRSEPATPEQVARTAAAPEPRGATRASVAVSGTGRLAAFSDGVLAIVMTLLVLDLRVPSEGQAGRGLGHYLLDQWPSYVAYVASFLVVGIIWLNHHAVLALLARSDHGLRVLNLLVLAAVSVIPFPTALLAEYAAGRHSVSDQRVAVLVYGGVMVAMSLLFNLFWRRIRAHPELRHAGITLADLRSRHRRFNVGLLLYPVVTLLGLLDVRVFLAGLLALAVLYLLPNSDPNTAS
jgi:uncharacterized membrane protein